MRELKFRAWIKTPGEMTYEIYSLTCYPKKGMVSGIMETDYEDLDYPKDIEILQFTGLHDRNGKEIYESDIVRDQDSSIMVIEWCDQEVGFRPYRLNGFMYKQSTVTDHPWWAALDWAEFTVIGNRYQNPELLEQKEA